MTVNAEMESKGTLPNKVVSFNPSDPESLNLLLGKYGPEGLFEISDVLKRVALKDMEAAIANLIAELNDENRIQS